MFEAAYYALTFIWKIVLTYYVVQILRLFILKKVVGRSLENIMIIFGSGGHTTEMLMLFKDYDFSRYAKGKIHFVLAKTDTTSKAKILDYFKNNHVNIDIEKITWFIIPRSREVGQSYFSSIFTTLYAFLATYWKITKLGALDVTVTNGPGTCIPVIAVLLINKFLLVSPSVKIVFIESWCRVVSLSLSGKLMYYLRLADKFMVHWPELRTKYKRAEYIGPLI